jgi:SAM-dependent methyltransferase
VTVFANDLWISATDNLLRFEEAGVADRVFPIHAEAHALPYANGFFDVAISIDSYHYYGTDELYFTDVFAKLVKPGGQFGIVAPGLIREFEMGYPPALKEHWDDGFFTFHSSNWWRRLWEKTDIVEIIACYDIENPKEIWYPWANWLVDNQKYSGDKNLLDADTQNEMTFIAMAAVKKGAHS